MSERGEQPDNALGDYIIEEQSTVAAPRKAAIVTGTHRYIKPENVVSSRHASEKERRPQPSRDTKARFFEKLNKRLEGQHQASPVADGSCLPKDPDFGGSWLPKDPDFNSSWLPKDPDFLLPFPEQQDIQRWPELNNTTFPQQPAHVRGNASSAVQTRDLPSRPRSTNHALTPSNRVKLEEWPYKSSYEMQPEGSHHTAAVPIRAPYTFTDVSYVDLAKTQIEGPPPIKALDHDETSDQVSDVENRPECLQHADPWAPEELNEILEANRSTTPKDVGPVSQLDEYAHGIDVGGPSLGIWDSSFHNGQVYGPDLSEPQVEKTFSPATSSEALVCSICKRGLRSKIHLR
jgi:hypothetical protein